MRKFFEESGQRFSWVDCDQCVTIRILLQRALRAMKRDTKAFLQLDMDAFETPIGPGTGTNFDVATENLTAFYTALADFQNQHSSITASPHFLILDRIDHLPDNPFDLITCLVRLNELTTEITNFCPVFIVSSLEPRALVTTHIPHVMFPQYLRDETIHILTSTEPCLEMCRLPESVLADTNQRLQFWKSYCNVLISALSSYTGSDLRLIKETAKKIWPAFIAPIISGKYKVTEFLPIYRENQDLFNSETAVSDKLISTSLIAPPLSSSRPSSSASSGLLQQPPPQPTVSNELPLQSKFIICAAYLASYNPPRFDIRFFSRAKEARAKRRDTGRRKLLKINPRQLAAPTFDLERMLAILHAIAPSTGLECFTDEPEKAFPSNIDIGVQIATLTELKLIVRTSSSDPLDSRTRWKINASFGLVQKLAKDIQLELNAFLIED